jgi:hypothetical protein
MKTYVILRRCGWRTAEDLREAVERAGAVVEQIPDDVRWIRSYVLAESDGSVGTVCVTRRRAPRRSAHTPSARACRWTRPSPWPTWSSSSQTPFEAAA